MNRWYRYSWEYRRDSRFSWYGDYGPITGRYSLRHEYGYWALTERGIRRKLARKIRAERRRQSGPRVSSRSSGSHA